jgi:hypothetical protein
MRVTPTKEARKAFRIAGKAYFLARSDLEQKLKSVVPKAPDKYVTSINGLQYSPKQAVGSALGIPLATFSTPEANRVLALLGFEISVTDGQPGRTKTLAERSLERYLLTNGTPDFEFARADLPNANRGPDYRLVVDGKEILFLVDDFRLAPPVAGGFWTGADPHELLRDKIDAAMRRLREFRKSCRCLVLFDPEGALADLNWYFVYSVLIGRPRIAREGAASAVTPPSRASRQMTDISAVVLLENLKVGERRLRSRRQRIERERGRKLTFDEVWDNIDQSKGTDHDLSLVQLRAVVHTDPRADRYSQVPGGLFCGTFDERYGLDHEGRLRRVFAGQELMLLEELELPNWERLEREIVRHFATQGIGHWHPTSLAALSQIVSRADHDEIVLVLRRLADVLHAVELRKWTRAGGRRQTRPFAGDRDVRPFFFGENGGGEDFEVRLTEYTVPFLP